MAKANTNPDLAYFWCVNEAPWIGYDLTRGYDGRDPKTLSPIEDSALKYGKVVWLNPRIRFQAFSPEIQTFYGDRFTADLGDAFEGFEFIETFVVDGVSERRRGVLAKVGGRTYPLNYFRGMTIGLNPDTGEQAYSVAEYDLSVDGPGKFQFIPFEKPAEDGGLGTVTFLPVKKAA